MVSRKNELLMSAGSMGASLNSDPIDVKNLIIGSLQIVFTGAPVGSIKLQASDDVYQFLKQPEPQPAPTNWTDIADSTLAIAAAGNIMYNLSSMGYDMVRVVYTRTSGTGTMSIRMVGKG